MLINLYPLDSLPVVQMDLFKISLVVQMDLFKILLIVQMDLFKILLVVQMDLFKILSLLVQMDLVQNLGSPNELVQNLSTN